MRSIRQVRRRARTAVSVLGGGTHGVAKAGGGTQLVPSRKRGKARGGDRGARSGRSVGRSHARQGLAGSLRTVLHPGRRRSISGLRSTQRWGQTGFLKSSSFLAQFEERVGRGKRKC